MTLVKWMLIGLLVRVIEILVATVWRDGYTGIFDKHFVKGDLMSKIMICASLTVGAFLWPIQVFSIVFMIIGIIDDVTNKKGS